MCPLVEITRGGSDLPSGDLGARVARQADGGCGGEEAVTAGALSEQRSIEVVIQGNRYVLTSDDEEQHVRGVAGMVDGALDKVTSGKGPPSYHVAVLTALNFASELVKLQREHESLKKAIDSRTGALIDLIDEKLTAVNRS